MVFSEEALWKLSKDELINMFMDYQHKSNSTLTNIDNDTGELRKTFDNLNADLANLGQSVLK